MVGEEEKKRLKGGDKFRSLEELEVRSPVDLEGSDSNLVGKIN